MNTGDASWRRLRPAVKGPKQLFFPLLLRVAAVVAFQLLRKSGSASCQDGLCYARVLPFLAIPSPSPAFVL
jgi:hypothetical protein